MTDLLKSIMERQSDAQKRHGYDMAVMTDEEKIEYIRWNVLALEDELHEALGETGWKPWASSKHINLEALKGELIDGLHFLANLFEAAEMEAEEVAARYHAKRDKNDKRMVEGYDGVSTKCEKCGRAQDDDGVLTRVSRREVQCLCGHKFIKWAHVDADYTASFVADRTVDVSRLIERLTRMGLSEIKYDVDSDAGRSVSVVLKCTYAARGNWPRDIEVKVSTALAEQGLNGIDVHAQPLGAPFISSLV